MKRKSNFETQEFKKKKLLNIQKLPDGIFFDILHYLNYSDLVNFSRTSKRFKHLEAKFPRLSLNMAEISLFHSIPAWELKDSEIFNYFKTINYSQLKKVSLKFCKRVTMNIIGFILSVSPKIEEMSLEGCSLSYKDLGFMLQNSKIENLRSIKLGIKPFTDFQYLSELEKFMEFKKINLDITICVQCHSILLTSMICQICKAKQCIGCNFTMHCSNCKLNECDSCSQGWDICNSCGNCSCSKSQNVRFCQTCQDTVCSNCCSCIQEEIFY